MKAKVSNINYNYKDNKKKRKIIGYYKKPRQEIILWPNTYPISEPIKIRFCNIKNNTVHTISQNFIVIQANIEYDYSRRRRITLELEEI